MKKLIEKVAVITGGSSGIGLATARRFIADGAQVIITSRNQCILDAKVAELGDRAKGIRADVTDMNDLDRLFSEIREKYGRVDVLFANAGIAPFSPFEAVTEDHFDSLFHTNVRGLFFTVQKALPVLSENASVILNASVVAQSGLPNTSVYAATKAAVRSLGRTLAAELSPRGIRVNVVSPGLIETSLWEKVGLSKNDVDAFAAQVVEQTPLRRAGKPHEIAATVAFLASDDASYFTGADLVADGGMVQV
ncbi:glucose 1-dehydrogenase [Pseudohalocynthiibacter sp. F2068]|uniref:SDR family oxidoreductase n=1 Tax=Pseudohalocynthiibacter sp. F2068 TaxID=2926418 RepID=UPI001FF3E93D|nr:glucose 1-dehydrogenase [Pseudohalocynthiibacter sp. F2068]MCK0104591.1 SDR family oxidoreductase [Pseudohalocynthiibacter sp. F2068]